MITVEQGVFGYRVETDVSERDKVATQKNFNTIKEINIYSWSNEAISDMVESPHTVAVWKLKKLKNEKDSFVSFANEHDISV